MSEDLLSPSLVLEMSDSALRRKGSPTHAGCLHRHVEGQVMMLCSIFVSVNLVLASVKSHSPAPLRPHPLSFQA